RLIVTSDDDVDTYEGQVTALGSLDVNLFVAGGTDGKILQLPGNRRIVSNVGAVYGLEYDSINELIYYTDASEGTLVRIKTDGSEPEILMNNLVNPRDIAINSTSKKVYVVDKDTHTIYEYDVNAESSSVLFDHSSNGLGQKPIGIDYYDKTLYVTCVEVDDESIWVGDENGTSITKIIDYSDGGYGYAIAVDKINEKIYFDDFDSRNILRANLDGTNIETVVPTVDEVFGIVIDNANGKIYWSDSGDGLIKKANLDGSDIVPVSISLPDPLGIFFIP
ncbi:hypothetical protein E1176_07550, partial [Fulvivirga sp. RKSG066]|uniref:hypothetical protein n=1 Tax=Fulvivirga aurantia TaxID=2529383 RepID=UPI0012BC6108